MLLPENSPGGVATAANAGLDRATGLWVGFVDGDDYVEPTMFERLVGAAAEWDADLAMCDYQEVVDDTGERRDPADAHRWAELTRPCYELDAHTRRLFLRFIAVPWRKLYRRSLLEDGPIRFPVSDGFYEDNPFHWFALISARSIAVVPEVLCYHRVGRAGQTMAVADERLFQIFQHHDTIHSWLAERRLLDVYQTALVGWVISQMEWIARRTPPALRRKLFDTLVPIFSEYSQATVASALREGNKGVTAQRLSAAVAKREYGSFVRAPLQPARLEQPGRLRRVPPTSLRRAAHGGARWAVPPQHAAGRPGHSDRRPGRPLPPRTPPAGRDVRPDGDPAAAPGHGEPDRRAGGPARRHRAPDRRARRSTRIALRRRRTGKEWQPEP